eukprot:TRINITY_DN2954_c0_g1_i1.p1 TRINITY_DN2954_c0_g1~~TRINITY_DN2954_c0_g1_i1.p1  ORF type:complete len:357 (+),score=56.66 TRINITY_DN2954_c0_g1_i1:1058-2128(+)
MTDNYSNQDNSQYQTDVNAEVNVNLYQNAPYVEPTYIEPTPPPKIQSEYSPFDQRVGYTDFSTLEQGSYQQSDQTQYQAYSDVESQETPSTTPTTETEPNPDVPSTKDFLKNPVQEISKLSMISKIHLSLALFICCTTFLVWHYTVVDPSTAFWWWMYPFFFFGLTFTAQIHYFNKNYFRGIVAIVIIINFLIFMTDGLTADGFPRYWIYPAGISAMVLLGVYYYKYTDHSTVSIVFYEYCILNALVFLAWLEEPYIDFPWWIIPMFVLGIPLAVMYLRVHNNETRWWVYIVVSSIIVNVLLFLVWGFIPSAFPWFLIPWGVSGSFAAFMWWRNRDSGHYNAIGEGDGPVAYTENQ